MSITNVTESVFDKYHKMENPSGCFSWKTIGSSFKFKKEDIVHSDALQEIDPVTSTIYSTKLYAVTPNELIRFPVLLYVSF